MNIAGIGSQQALALFDRRLKEKQLSEELGPAAVATSQQPRTFSGSTADYQAEQAFEESFAKLRVGLQSSDASGSSLAGKAESSSNRARDAFHEYMAMSDAEKMRDAILREMGLTEEEVDAMSPEQQEAIEKQIAERMQQRAELQAAKEQEEKSDGISANNASAEEEKTLLS
jgi:hypothetical protein